jgi:hypothetical protein
MEVARIVPREVPLVVTSEATRIATGGGIGGVRVESVNSELRTEKLGQELAVGGECAMVHIWTRE